MRRNPLLPLLPLILLVLTSTIPARASEYVMPKSFVVGPGEHVLKFNGSSYDLRTDVPLEIVFHYLGGSDYKVIFKNRHPESGSDPDREIFLSIRGNDQVVYFGPVPSTLAEVYYTNETGYTEP